MASTVVIIVEDDEALRQALRFMFTAEGFEAIALASGEELTRLAAPPDPYCLVIDQRLPGMSGLESLQTLRDRGVEAPAILITTDPDGRVRQAADRTGAVIVEKPLLGDLLLAAVRTALAEPAAS